MHIGILVVILVAVIGLIIAGNQTKKEVDTVKEAAGQVKEGPDRLEGCRKGAVALLMIIVLIIVMGAAVFAIANGLF